MWGRTTGDRFKIDRDALEAPGPGHYDVKVAHDANGGVVLGTTSERFKELENQPPIENEGHASNFTALEAPDKTRRRLSTNLKAMSIKVLRRRRTVAAHLRREARAE